MKNNLYTLKISLSFDSAHQIFGYDGPCARVHGHTYKVEAEIQGKKLNHLGMVIDCYEIKKHLNPIIAQLDHYHLNDLPAFEKINPTAENIAAWIFDRLAEKLNTDDVHVRAITLRETENFCVRYELCHSAQDPASLKK